MTSILKKLLISLSHFALNLSLFSQLSVLPTQTNNYYNEKIKLFAIVKLNKQPIQDNGSPLLGRPFQFLIAKMRVDLRRSAYCLWSNFVAIWVNAQLENCFSSKPLLSRRVFKTENYTKALNILIQKRYSPLSCII